MGARIQYRYSPVRLIQRGTITITAGNAAATATVTSVNTAKARLTHLGATIDTGGSAGTIAGIRLTLTNATTVTATRVGTTEDYTVSYELVEFV
jgi:hypothetical protein